MFKTVLKRLLKNALRVLLGLGLLIATYLLIAVILSLLGSKPEPVACPKKQRIYVTTNGVHLGLP